MLNRRPKRTAPHSVKLRTPCPSTPEGALIREDDSQIHATPDGWTLEWVCRDGCGSIHAMPLTVGLYDQLATGWYDMLAALGGTP